MEHVVGIRRYPEVALRALLEPKGWATMDAISAMCKERGISKGSIYRAKDELHVKALRAQGNTWWALPDLESGTLLAGA